VVADLDGDAMLDVAFANGHIEPTIGEISESGESFAQPLQVFRNVGGGGFQASDVAGLALVGRGLASGDLDLDGDLDLVVSQNGGPVALLRNDSPPRPWLRVRLRGRRANTWGQGAEVEIAWADGRRALRRLEPSGSYLSSSEPVLTVGLGDRGAPARLVVRWPGGSETVVEAPAVGRELEVAEEAANEPSTREPRRGGLAAGRSSRAVRNERSLELDANAAETRPRAIWTGFRGQPSAIAIG
jgi:hypothetical protein